MPDGHDNHLTLPPSGSRWDGVNESSDAVGAVVRALNVDFRDGRICRRRGRQVIATIHAGTPVQGIFEHVSVEGDRKILVCSAAASPAGGDPQVDLLDPCTHAPVSLALSSPAISTDPRHGFAWTSQKGMAVLADPNGRMFRFDGALLAALEALPGDDAASGVLGARAYLTAPPLSDELVTWRNRVVSIRSYRVGLSAYSGDIMVPVDAPAGAANVWPAMTNFDVTSQDGDEIVGAAIWQDLLVLLLRRGVAVVDEDEASPIPRTVDRENGCIARRSVQVVGNSIVYLADGKVCRWKGGQAEDISSDHLAETLKLVDWAAARFAVSAHLTSRNEYRLWLPVAGLPGNRICVIFDYRRGKWRTWAGWLPWDDADRQDANQPFDVVCAATVLDPGGSEVLLTGDSQGRVWREDVGETDAGSVFPAFAALAPIGDGEREFTWGDTRADLALDGSYVEVMHLRDGTQLETELVRIASGSETVSQRNAHRAIDEGRSTFAAPALPSEKHASRLGRAKFSLAGRAARLQIVLMLPGKSPDGLAVDPAPGGVKLLEVATRRREGAR